MSGDTTPTVRLVDELAEHLRTTPIPASPEHAGSLTTVGRYASHGTGHTYDAGCALCRTQDVPTALPAVVRAVLDRLTQLGWLVEPGQVADAGAWRARIQRLEDEHQQLVTAMADERDRLAADVADYRGRLKAASDATLAARNEAERLRGWLTAAQIVIRALTGRPRPGDDPARALWDAEQRAELLRRQADQLTQERDQATAEAERLRAVIAELVPIAQYVSRGRRHVDVEPYPDGDARRALGTAREAGLP